jgi:hypothetical protein
MGTKFWEVVCDKHGIGSSGVYCSDNESHLDRINVFHHEALGGKYVPCAALFYLEPGVTGAVKTGPKTITKELSANSSDSPLYFRSLCSQLRAPHRAGGTSIGPFVCGARACSLCSLKCSNAPGRDAQAGAQTAACGDATLSQQ